MKKKMDIILTASHKFSVTTEILCDLLIKKGINVKAIIILPFFSIKRAKYFIKKYGLRFIFLKVLNNIFLILKVKNNKNKYINHIEKFIIKNSITLVGLEKKAFNKKIKIFYVENLNAEKSLNIIKSIKHDLVVYSGGGILKSGFIDQASDIINAHAGPLPEIRGFNAAEWSLLLNKRNEITIHFIDKGIDTGKIIKSFPYDIFRCKNRDELRELSVITGIEGLINVISTFKKDKLITKNQKLDDGKQYFSIAPIFERIINKKLINKRLISSN